MTMMSTWVQDRERGSLAVFTVVIAAALVILLGVVVDGGAKLHAMQSAQATAREAARAGGQAVQASAVIRGQDPVADPAQAVAAAQAYLAAAGAPGSVEVAGDSLVVTAEESWSPTFLGAIGIGPQTETGQADARLVRALEGVEQ